MYNFLLSYYYRIRGLIRRKFYLKVGSNSFISNTVQILGLKNILIGCNTTIGDNSLITINNRSDASVKLIIGDNVYIGRNNFFTVGDVMTIGDYCIFGNNCSFISSNHNFSNPMMPYALSGATDSNKIEIGLNCWLGYNVSIIGSVKIGHGSIIGANSVVLKDVPPFSIAVGNPAKVIKVFNFNLNVWEKIKDISTNDYINYFPDETTYANKLFFENYSTYISHHSASFNYGDL